MCFANRRDNSTAKNVFITTVHFISEPCVMNACQGCERCEMQLFFLGCSISDISHSACITPSSPKSPQLSILLPPSPFWASLLFDHSSSAAPSCPISVSPSLPPSLPSSHSPPAIFTDFLTCHSTDCYHLCVEGEAEGYWYCSSESCLS